ncbi:Ribonuclease 3-like protein [Thalictrum thalictroides]|uniref:Ribonuclease 3-like protein n=1 Tax=Thalictrum thalictroides TaxID=46969 RepID=A0A7J6VZG1_THATH|nr:Ribonuclease 3-like protein [Thalictrum thalictroides]
MAKKKRTSQSYEIVESYSTPTHYEASPSLSLSPSPSPSPVALTVVVDDNFNSSLEEVEVILNYQFRDKSLLEAALTHSSYSDSPSYQRLEFIGDAALGLAVANFVFIKYPELDPGMLSLLRSANISTEKLARVAVRHNLFGYVRHNAPSLALKVNEFSLAIEQEGDEILPYGGLVKAPKVLADITESVAAAIYVDCNFNLKLLWEFFSPLLEPIVTVENIQQQPVTMVYEICQKEGKSVNFTHWRKGTQNFTNIFVNGKLMGSGSSEKKEISKLSAAKQALDKLWMSQALPTEEVHCSTEGLNGVDEICGAKQKLIELCHQKQWPKPTYR